MLIFCIGSTLYAFELLVAPTGFYIDLDKNNAQEIVVQNPSTEKIRAEIKFERPQDTDEDSYMGKWIKVYPKILTLNPGQSKTVRFSVRKPQGVEDGEYKTMIVFDEKKPQIQKQEMIDENGERITGEVMINFRIAIEAYGKVGKRQATGTINKLELKKEKNGTNLALDFSAGGNAYPLIFYRADFLDSHGKVIATREERIDRYPKQQRTTVTKTLENIPKNAVKTKITIKEKETQEIIGIKEFQL